MFYLFVEGHGENSAAQKLVHKILDHYNMQGHYFSEGIRWKNLHMETGLKKAVDYARLLDNVEGILFMRDDEDNCPKTLAPSKAEFLRGLNAPFPIAYCIMYREYESLFAAYMEEFAGKTIEHAITGKIRFANQVQVLDDPESKRDAKGFVSDNLAGNRVYKPTTDQFTLTRALDIQKLAEKQLPCFDTLVRCIQHLVSNLGKSFVYPA